MNLKPTHTNNHSVGENNTFGMPMPNRSFSYQIGSSYRFGFNGQSKDNEVYGFGNLNTALFWEYDTRLGRRWNLDPVVNHTISSYSVFNGNPILYDDPNGDCALCLLKQNFTDWWNSPVSNSFAHDLEIKYDVKIKTTGQFIMWNVTNSMNQTGELAVIVGGPNSGRKYMPKTTVVQSQELPTLNRPSRRTSNFRKPDPEAVGDHSVFNKNGNTTYKVNKQNPSGYDEVKRTDITGTAHTNPDGTIVSTPHVHTKGNKYVRSAVKSKDY